MKVYRVKPEYLYGDEKQLALLDSLGLKESNDNCDAEDAISLLNLGYCGNYLPQMSALR